MLCPKCGSDSKEIGTTHYVCTNPECIHDGGRTQFRVVEDNKVCFPYNQIFVGRSKKIFVQKPYLVFENVGIDEL